MCECQLHVLAASMLRLWERKYLDLKKGGPNNFRFFDTTEHSQSYLTSSKLMGGYSLTFFCSYGGENLMRLAHILYI